MSGNACAASTFPATRDADGATRIAVPGSLLYENRNAFRAVVVDVLDQGATNVVLDLGRCGDIDSAGLGTIVTCSKRAKERGAAFRVEGLNEDLTTLFSLTKLDQVVPIVRGVSR